MKAWPKTRLDECCEIVSGATPSTSISDFWDGDICWATPKDLSDLEGAYIGDTARKLTRKGLSNCAAAVLPPGSVLFSSRAPIGHTAINTVPMATNQGFKSFIPDPNRLSAKYLLYWLRKNRGYLESLGNGATFKEVSKAVVSRIKIPLPSLQEQLHIAGILDRTYALQAKRRETISQLELLAQSMFLDLFGDPAINAKSWPQKALGELLADAEVFVDGDWVETKDQDPSGDVRLIQLADVGDGHYVDKSARFLTQETATRLKCTFLKRNDVLVARMPDPLGRACLFPGDSREAVTVVDVCIIRPRNADPDPRWLMWCINSRGFRSLIAREVTGTTRQRISRGNLSRLPIIAPPIVDQREFSRRVDAVERVKSASQVSLIDFNALFCSLEHRAFKGEL